MQPFRILLLNASYCLGLKGTIADYSLHSYRFLFCSKKIQAAVIEKLHVLIKNKNPDLCCFLEIDKGSKFSNRLNQIGRLVNETYPFHSIESKYGRFSRKLWRLKNQSNGFLAKKNLSFTKHFFKHGAKKLFYEIELNESVHLFMVHFSLGKRIRQKQMNELAQIVKRKNKVIVCGDFNLKSYDELHPLLHDCDLNMINAKNDRTFPSHKPRKMFDLFLCSKNIQVKDFKVLDDVKISDHLPVLLEVAI